MNHNALLDEMIRYEAGVPGRIQHLLKVHAFSKLIGEEEGLDEETLATLEAASIVHDIGIKPALEKYGSSAGPYQEKEGAPVAHEMLTRLGYDEKRAERVAFLVGHHHTYTAIDGPDYQILVEADFLVNLYENGDSKEEALSVREKIFKTEAGKKILNNMFEI